MDLACIGGSACCLAAGVLLAAWPLAYLLFTPRITVTWTERQ